MIVKNVSDISRRFHSQIISLAEVKTKRPYIAIRLRLMTDEPNINDESVTREFMADIVENKKDHIGLPLYADVSKIKAGDYLVGMGHKYDKDGNVFHTEQIGSFYDFELEEVDGITSLIGEARVYKRDRDVAVAILKAYQAGALNFSFEIQAGSTRSENGLTIVDKDPHNFILGMAWVSKPAYDSANALALTAEQKSGEERSVKHARISLSGTMIAEASIGTVTSWIYHAVNKYISDKIGYFYFEFYHIGLESALLYAPDTGIMFKAEYVIKNDGVWVSDMYEVEVTRAGGANASSESEELNVENEVNKEAQALTPEATETAPVTAQAEGTPAPVIDLKDQSVTIDNTSADQPIKKAEEEEPVDEVADLKARLAEQEKTLASLREIETKWLAAEEERNKQIVAEKKARLTKFAEKSGLDLKEETVIAAVEGMNYEQLVELAVALKAEADPTEPEAAAVVVAEAIVNPNTAEISLKGKGWLYSKA